MVSGKEITNIDMDTHTNKPTHIHTDVRTNKQTHTQTDTLKKESKINTDFFVKIVINE